MPDPNQKLVSSPPRINKEAPPPPHFLTYPLPSSPHMCFVTPSLPSRLPLPSSSPSHSLPLPCFATSFFPSPAPPPFSVLSHPYPTPFLPSSSSIFPTSSPPLFSYPLPILPYLVFLALPGKRGRVIKRGGGGGGEK